MESIVFMSISKIGQFPVLPDKLLLGIFIQIHPQLYIPRIVGQVWISFHDLVLSFVCHRFAPLVYFQCDVPTYFVLYH